MLQDPPTRAKFIGEGTRGREYPNQSLIYQGRAEATKGLLGTLVWRLNLPGKHLHITLMSTLENFEIDYAL